jgi:phosphate:Na+ symporter
VSPFEVALIHTIFNVLITVVFFPFRMQMEKLCCRIIPDAPDDKDTFLDPLLLATPSIAIAESRNAVNRMAVCTRDALDVACAQVRGYREDMANYIMSNEDKIDSYQDHIGSFLLQVNQHGPSVYDADELSHLLLLINEYERLGDHAVKIFDVMSGLHDQGSSFTEEAQKDMDRILTALTDCYAEAFRCDIEGDAEGAGALLPLKQVIGKFCEILRDRHSRRLAEGICSAEQGLAFNDILTYIESIASHSINIATAAVRYSPGKFSSSEYMHNLNTVSQRSYQERYDALVKKYISSEF